MLASQRTKPQCREFNGPTPHSAAVRAKFPSSRPPDYLILDRRRQEDARDKVLEFTKYQQTCDLRTTWQKRTDRSILVGTIERQVKDAMNQYEMSIDERRDRLRGMLEAEEQQLMREIEDKKETVLERQAKMRERAKTLKERRESERQQLVADKLEQLFREQSEELRAIQTKRREEEVCVERAAQLRSRQEQRQQRQEEERLFAELWDADRQAKEERESQDLQRQQQSNMEQLGYLRAQMEAAEQQRQQAKQLKEEEAQLLREQREMLQLKEQREQQQKHQGQETRRRQLDQCLRLKMKRLAREQQDELELDMSILQQLLTEERDEKQDAAQRKILLRDEQQKYRQYLADELEKQKRQEEETEQLIEAELKETWAKREKKSQMQREARNRLMKDVMETRHLQIQQKLDLNMQKQIQLAKDRDELNKTIEGIKVLDEEQKRRHKQTCQAYQADLRAQMMHQQQLRSEEKAQAEREHRQGLAVQEEYEKKKQDILSRPGSHTTAVHPFRRTEGSRSSARRQLSLTESG
uniref:cilia- and flagella-associated protein 53 n=1 Tax=Centroberyx gerrardi TaxID=166262 RepID=UPI003AAA810B